MPGNDLPTPVQNALTALHERLDELPHDDPAAVVAALSEARALLDEALDEAMAQAALDGASMRSVAQAAAVAPNTVPPRLARTAALAEYAAEGRVTSGALERARHDRRHGQYQPAADAPTPLRFRRRT